MFTRRRRGSGFAPHRSATVSFGVCGVVENCVLNRRESLPDATIFVLDGVPPITDEPPSIEPGHVESLTVHRRHRMSAQRDHGVLHAETILSPEFEL
jgi:hypothetical protein